MNYNLDVLNEVRFTHATTASRSYFYIIEIPNLKLYLMKVDIWKKNWDLKNWIAGSSILWYSMKGSRDLKVEKKIWEGADDGAEGFYLCKHGLFLDWACAWKTMESGRGI